MKNKLPGKSTPISAITIVKRWSPWVISCIVLLPVLAACRKDKLPDTTPANFVITPASVTMNINAGLLQTVFLLKDKDTLPAGDVVWRSANEEVVTFNAPGILLAKWAGITDVMAYSKEGKELARCAVTVTDSNVYKLRLVLKDKGQYTTGPLSNPTVFLSAKALQRRQKQAISIDESDLPISNDYLQEISRMGGTIVAKSKWLKTVSVHINDGALLHKYKALPFVADAKVVWAKRSNAYQVPSGSWSFPGSNATAPPNITISTDNSVYGPAYENIKQNKGNILHESGFKGRNIAIAVIDAGYKDVDKNTLLNNVHLLGAKSFIYEKPNPFFMDEHGVAVLSIIAGAQPALYVGAAPEASYLLLTSEDNTDEFPVEEDYYVNALEYADSAGVDIINTSLGYKEYQLPGANNTFEILNGATAHASRGVSMAFSKGILVVVAAGNDGSFVGSPADSPGALTIGMTDATGAVVTASSRGVTVDGRIKPDIIARGAGAYRITSVNTIATGTGTSFATPVVTGMAACLWQAFPNLTSRQIRAIILQSSDRYATPALPYGYGLPDMQKAYSLAQNLQ